MRACRHGQGVGVTRPNRNDVTAITFRPNERVVLYDALLTRLSRMPHVTPIEVAAVDRQLCDECGLCMPLCPPMAIHMRREGLIVDPATCTGCRKCIAPCPVGALSMVPNPVLAAAVAMPSLPTTSPAVPLA